jgi:hypothetical protein
MRVYETSWQSLDGRPFFNRSVAGAVHACLVRAVMQRRQRVLYAACSMTLCLLGFGAHAAHAQVAEAAVGGEQRLSVGGLLSGFHLDYGKRTLGGAGIYVDAELNPHLGIEGEARWMFLHQENQTKYNTYLGGPRYQFSAYGRFRPYVKALVGGATFQFPYKYATGSYFVISPGGGVDFRLNHRIRLRLVDFEYQYWPDFTYGTMSTYGLSTGVSYGF